MGLRVPSARLLAGMDWMCMHAWPIPQPKALAENAKSSLHRGAKHGKIGIVNDLLDEPPTDPTEPRALAAARLDRYAGLERLRMLGNE